MSHLSIYLKLPTILIICILTLPLAASQLSLTVTVSTNKTQYSPGDTVAISGTVRSAQGSQVLGASVSIQIDDPQTNPVHISLVSVDQSGAYTDHFTLASNAVQGKYSIYVTASQSGYANAQNQTQFSVPSGTASTTSSTPSSSSSSTSSSSSISSSLSSSSSGATSVSFPQCFIATATYGSDLAPEVTLLRNFRDMDILNTSAGENFLKVFNAFYYSFSPQVASFIAHQSQVRAAFKLLLYPLIGILEVSKFVFDALSFDGEVAVTLSGILASLAIGAVYVGPFLTILSRVFRRWSASAFVRGVRLGSLIAISSIASLVFAELIKDMSLLEVAAVGVVLSNIVVGALAFCVIITRIIARITWRRQ